MDPKPGAELTQQEDGRWMARHLDGISIATDGATREQALDHLVRWLGDIVNERNEQLRVIREVAK